MYIVKAYKDEYSVFTDIYVVNAQNEQEAKDKIFHRCLVYKIKEVICMNDNIIKIEECIVI